jgi:hypothetical protein
MIIAMDQAERQKVYDEIVESERKDLGGSVNLYYKALYDHCETPEEILAAKVVESQAYSPHSKKPTTNYSEFAAVRWPWGDARGVLMAGGRGYWEARLRLRDKLVESARELIQSS